MTDREPGSRRLDLDEITSNILSYRLHHESASLAEVLQIDLAHAVMLTETGILASDEGARLVGGLLELVDAQADGRWQLSGDPSAGSVLLQVEKELVARVGAATAGRLRLGRSRVDHTGAVARLAARNRLLEVREQQLMLLRAYLEVAVRERDTVVPGWTQGQRAQPWLLGHQLLSVVFQGLRHSDRLAALYGRVNQNPLGGAALVGTEWEVDRERVAALLGEDGIVENAHDAGQFTIDWLLEYAAVLSGLLLELGRRAGDLYVLASHDVRLVSLPDELSGISSMMPQKRNPVPLQFVRGAAGRAAGWFPTTYAISRTATSTDADQAYVGTVVHEAAELTSLAITTSTAVIQTLEVDRSAAAAQAADGWTTSSGLADLFVARAELDYRTAHGVVKALIGAAEERGVEPGGVDRALVLEVWPDDGPALPRDVDDPAIALALDPIEFLRTRRSRGGTAPASVEAQERSAAVALAEHDGTLTTAVSAVSAARQELRAAARSLIQT